jgi:hypothetical protein
MSDSPPRASERSPLTFETLLPGHGVFARRRGRRHVDAALRQIDQLKTPRAIEFVDV